MPPLKNNHREGKNYCRCYECLSTERYCPFPCLLHVPPISDSVYSPFLWAAVTIKLQCVLMVTYIDELVMYSSFLLVLELLQVCFCKFRKKVIIKGKNKELYYYCVTSLNIQVWGHLNLISLSSCFQNIS